MSRLLTLLSLLAILITFPVYAQNLPKSWSISPDGRRLMAGGENNAGFYRQDQIREVELAFSQPDWWRRLLNNHATKTDLPATCWIDGIRYDSVGVRFRGNSSFRYNDSEKKSFNITLDRFIDGQDVGGVNTFNLNCGWQDSTSMREVLYNNIGQHYHTSLKSNFVSLTINGEDWGPYANVQQPDSDFIKEWYLSNDGTIWRAKSNGGGTPSAGVYGRGKSSLNYNGPDSSDYHRDYTLKRTEQDDPWAGLIAACDVLNNAPLLDLEGQLARVFDIDKACWFLAHENIFADSDSYINKGGLDYYVYYEAETGRIVPVEYDGNGVLVDRLLNMRLFHHASNHKFPLMHRMLAVPAIRQRYLAHVRVILNEYFNPEFIYPVIDRYTKMIDPLVQADPRKFYTYEQFLEATAELKRAVASRRAALINEPELMGVEPLMIDDLSHSVRGIRWQSPTHREAVNVTARVGGNLAVASVWLHYSTGLTGPFAKTRMYDDGRHEDGAAGDGHYGAAVLPQDSASYVRYYVAAVAADAAATVSYAPSGAEHDVFLYRIDNTSPLNGAVVINEFMAANNITRADQDGEFDDWIELYNNTDAEVSLAGFHLTDDVDEPTKFTFPAGTAIDANGYLIVWADGDLDQEGLHADFKLGARGETILLSDADLMVVDSITYADQNDDISHGRFPNGTGDFQNMRPTFNAENTAGITGPDVPTLMISPLAGDLVLNEFMADNETTRADQDGDFDDWIELYNNTDAAIVLDGFHLADNTRNPALWAFPAGTTIAPNGYLVVWADDDGDQEGLHAGFKLSAGGETLLLTDADTALVDSVTYSVQTVDITHGRFPNGTGDFKDMTPTFGAMNNDGIVSTRYEVLTGAELTLFPNPVRDRLNVRLDEVYPKDLRFRLFATDGSLLRENVLRRGSTMLEIDADGLPQGAYLLEVADGRALAVHKVIVGR